MLERQKKEAEEDVKVEREEREAKEKDKEELIPAMAAVVLLAPAEG